MKSMVLVGGIRSREMIRLLAGCALLSSLAWGVANAEVAEPTAAETVARLSEAYAKLDGFKVIYRSTGEGKSLECTIGLDEISGLSAMHMVVKRGGLEMDFRQWNTVDDEVFVGSAKDLLVFKGMNGEFQSLRDLVKGLNILPDGIGKGGFQLTPYLLMTRTAVSPSSKWKSQDELPLATELKDAPIQASDAKSVTFLTGEYGLLTVSRENGLLIRQSVTSDKGEVRVLELKEIQLNPGGEAIRSLSADWSGDGAKDQAVLSLMAPIRLQVFQNVINAVEAGAADLGKLETLLGKQNVALRQFAAACISETGDSFAATADWKKLLNRDKVREMWLKKDPGARAGDEKAFEAFIAKPEVREGFRDSMIDGILEVDGASERIMAEIFGKEGWSQVKAPGETGQFAKKLIGKALTRAYFESMIDRKMVRFWGERKGLD